MAPISNELTRPLTWREQLFRFARMPKFQFMVHDRWANVLFLHWRIPEDLEADLINHTSPFEVERYDGSFWIGLILLTEEQVGPSIGRSNYTCVTHHGINVRTYVRGAASKRGDPSSLSNDPILRSVNGTNGIHFSSLECDDEFTSFGANFFGMPYRVANMKRSYEFRSDEVSTTVKETKEGKEIVSNSSSTHCHYHIRSERLPSGSPSFFRMMYHALTWWRPTNLHCTTKRTTSGATPDHSHEKHSQQPTSSDSLESCETNGSQDQISSSQQFTVECSWNRSSTHTITRSNETFPKDDSLDSSRNDVNNPSRVANDEPFHEWATERYFVYTHKYGRNWRGQVEHEPWPLETSTTTPTSIQLETLTISGVESYEPKPMRPILRHMARNKPDHVGFSPGVGPVTFTMLQPV